MMNTCPICGRKYTAPPVTSRIDGEIICTVCGVAESMARFPKEMKEEVIRKIEEHEIT